MTPMTAPGPLDLAETAEIEALLAELMPEAAATLAPPGEAAPPERPPVFAAPTAPATASADPGPLPAPLGVLPLADVFALMNWRNRPDEARPRPLIRPPDPPPPPGAEWTVTAVLSQFGWE
jgi:hypothetical protein